MQLSFLLKKCQLDKLDFHKIYKRHREKTCTLSESCKIGHLSELCSDEVSGASQKCEFTCSEKTMTTMKTMTATSCKEFSAFVSKILGMGEIS